MNFEIDFPCCIILFFLIENPVSWSAGLCGYNQLILLVSGNSAMSGLIEIIIIVAIILSIILLPRMLRRQPEFEIRPLKRVLKLTGWERMAILASFLWLAFFALYLKPWNNDWHIFLYMGLSPVVLFWGIFWIFLGFRKKGR